MAKKKSPAVMDLDLGIRLSRADMEDIPLIAEWKRRGSGTLTGYSNWNPLRYLYSMPAIPDKLNIRRKNGSSELHPVDLYELVPHTTESPAQYHRKHQQAALSRLFIAPKKSWHQTFKAGAYATVLIVLSITVGLIVYLLLFGD